jgi:Helitron helicase-like domain at N-terminus
VDGWAITEQWHLDWVQRNLTQLRADTYCGLTDAFAVDPQMDAQKLGQRVILPSSFSGSSQNMIQHCQNALAINCHYRGANLFLTMTANPNWQEIKDALLPGQTPADRPDLVDHVFYLQVQELLDDIFKRGCLGKAVACVWTIEFQKRGLPHVHMIIFLHPDSKLRTPEDIDTLLSAEFLDKDEEPEPLELVKKFMVHTPCGAENPNAPCMQDGKCSKGVSKPFREQTTVNEDSYANLRRWDTGKKYQVGGHEVDNKWVVPYPRFWLWKFCCHINMKCLF